MSFAKFLRAPFLQNNSRRLLLFSIRIDNEKLLEKYRAIWIQIKDLKKNKLNALPVYDDRYIKTKIMRQ